MPIQTQLLATIVARLTPGESPATAASAEAVWRCMFDRFGPLIGPLSAGLLFERSLVLHAGAFPWLDEAMAAGPDGAILSNYVSALKGRPAADIAAANSVLLKTYTDELAGLIGASLASRLLQSAFAPDRVPDNT